MAKFTVCLVETREYILEVEADTAAEATEIALEEGSDSPGYQRDSFREHTVDWVEPA